MEGVERPRVNKSKRKRQRRMGHCYHCFALLFYFLSAVSLSGSNVTFRQHTVDKATALGLVVGGWVANSQRGQLSRGVSGVPQQLQQMKVRLASLFTCLVMICACSLLELAL